MTHMTVAASAVLSVILCSHTAVQAYIGDRILALSFKHGPFYIGRRVSQCCRLGGLSASASSPRPTLPPPPSSSFLRYLTGKSPWFIVLMLCN